MPTTYDRLPSSEHDATHHALAEEVTFLRYEAVLQRKEAATLHQTIAGLREHLDAAHESKEVVEDALLGNADRIETLEAQLEAVQSVLRAQLRAELDPRVAAAAVLFKALTGREQPMDRTAEDVIAELQILVDQSGSEIWEKPPVPVTLTYIVTVTGKVENPNRDPVVLFEQLDAEFILGTTANCRFSDFKVAAVSVDGVQYGD